MAPIVAKQEFDQVIDLLRLLARPNSAVLAESPWLSSCLISRELAAETGLLPQDAVRRALTKVHERLKAESPLHAGILELFWTGEAVSTAARKAEQRWGIAESTFYNQYRDARNQFVSLMLQMEAACRTAPAPAGARDFHTRLLQPDPPAPQAQSAALGVECALVGRQEEWRTLRSMWSKAVQSGAHMVWIAGEAGIGKTRLAEELLIHAQQQGHAAARTRAYALEGRLTYAPLADWLRTPPLQMRLARLDRVWLSEVARLLPELLIQHAGLSAPEPLSERWQQRVLFEALRHAFTSENRPLLLLLDDLQWCDPETLAWVQYLIETAPEAPLLVIGTLRGDEVEEGHPLHKLRRTLLRAGRLSTIELAPLSAEETANLGAQVAKQSLSSSAAADLFEATGGNPLFIVEIVRSGGNGARANESTGLPARQAAFRGSDIGLPPKVYAVIEARLAQLTLGARTLAQVAATIGRAFTLALLREASQEDEAVVVRGLDELWQRRIVREQSGAHYDFTHDRIRDVVYADCGPVKRIHFHGRVAQALEKLHAADLDPLAGELAMHYQHAGAWEEAFVYFCRAAAVAKQLCALRDQVDYLQKAIAAAQMLPASETNSALEIDLWYDLGLAQQWIDWGSELAAISFQKSDELAAEARKLPQRLRALAWLTMNAIDQAQLHKARTLNELAVSLAQEAGDVPSSDHLTSDYGLILFHSGDFAQALATFRLHPACFRDPAQMARAWADGMLPPTIYLGVARSLWLLGFPDQALACGRELLMVEQQHIDLLVRSAGLMDAGLLFSFLRDAVEVQKIGEQVLALAIKYDIPIFAMMGAMLSGWALAQQGAVQQGLTLLQKAVEEGRGWSFRIYEPNSRALFAETLALAGEYEEAYHEVAGALAAADECGNSYWNAHLLKLQGDFLHARSISDLEVEASYQRAIATARRQGAKTLELRATTALCRLWYRQGRQVKARAALTAIYSWFTEGFDTPDMQEAKALLDR